MSDIDELECDVSYLRDTVWDLECEVSRLQANLEEPTLIFQRIHPDAQLPQYATVGSAGMDIRAVEAVDLYAGERCVVATGLKVIIPSGWELQVRPRSGLAFKHGVTVLNSPGTIDSDYRGEIKVILQNTSKSPYNTFNIAVGDRIAQLVLTRVPRAAIVETDKNIEEIAGSERGSGGLGSTGQS